MKTKSITIHAITGCVLLILSAAAFGEMIGIATSKETLSKSYAGKAYSPYAQRSFPAFPLWGDIHLHTSLSFDAGGFGNRLDPSTAYRFARGEEVISSTGQPVRLARPLDWLAITDHSDGMGFIDDVLAASPLVTNYEHGSAYTRSPRSKVTVKPIRSCHRMMSSPITGPGMSATWTYQMPRRTTCSLANMLVKP